MWGRPHLAVTPPARARKSFAFGSQHKWSHADETQGSCHLKRGLTLRRYKCTRLRAPCGKQPCGSCPARHPTPHEGYVGGLAGRPSSDPSEFRVAFLDPPLWARWRSLRIRSGNGATFVVGVLANAPSLQQGAGRRLRRQCRHDRAQSLGITHCPSSTWRSFLNSTFPSRHRHSKTTGATHVPNRTPDMCKSWGSEGDWKCPLDWSSKSCTSNDT